MTSEHTEIPQNPKAPKTVFLAAIVVIFALTLTTLDSIGFVPDYIDGSATLTTGGSTGFTAGGTDAKVALKDLPQLGEETVALPDRIVAPAIGLDLPVQNPATRDVPLLDEALKSGPVRYVDSAKLGEKGNMLVFAHSSHLPIVHNQMYRAFNRINELKAGDAIIVSGGGKEYRYEVTSVRLTDANEELIDLSKKNGTRLTLSTCDTFGAKTARWVVEAKLAAGN